VKVGDFGLVRSDNTTEPSELTEPGTAVGTLGYLSPERLRGDRGGPPADVYALGALVRHVAAGPLAPGLAALVEAALADDPAARPTAAEFHERLERGVPAVAASGSAVGDGPPDVTAGSGAAESAPTEIRAGGRTEVLPRGGDVAPPRGGGVAPPPRRPWAGAVVAVAALFVVLVALALNLAASGHGHRAPAPAPTATATATSGPPASGPATGVPAATDPSGAARDLATWLRGQGR